MIRMTHFPTPQKASSLGTTFEDPPVGHNPSCIVKLDLHRRMAAYCLAHKTRQLMLTHAAAATEAALERYGQFILFRYRKNIEYSKQTNRTTMTTIEFF